MDTFFILFSPRSFSSFLWHSPRFPSSSLCCWEFSQFRGKGREWIKTRDESEEMKGKKKERESMSKAWKEDEDDYAGGFTNQVMRRVERVNWQRGEKKDSSLTHENDDQIVFDSLSFCNRKKRERERKTRSNQMENGKNHASISPLFHLCEYICTMRGERWDGDRHT